MANPSQQNPISARAKAERKERGIRLLPNGRYEVRVHIGRDPLTGRLRQVSRVVDGGIRAARAKRAQLITEVEHGDHGGTESTVGYLLDAWNAQREALGAAPTTLIEDRRLINAMIRPAIGSVKLDKLDTRTIDRFYAIRLRDGASPAAIAHYHAILRAALTQGRKWGWVTSNVALDATRPRVPKAELHTPTPAEVQKLIDTAASSRAPELAGIITVAALTGLRAGELCALRFSDVIGTRLTVRSARWVRGKESGIKDPKSHQQRSLTLSQLATVVIDRRKRMMAAAAEMADADALDGFVWSGDHLGTEPLSPRGLSTAFGRIAAKAGVPCRFHDLRHFAGTELVAAGLDPRTVADRLGHADPAFTLRVYASGRAEREEAAAAVMEQTLAKVPALAPVNDESPEH